MAVYSFTDLMLAYAIRPICRVTLYRRESPESGAEAVRLLLAEPPELQVDYACLQQSPDVPGSHCFCWR